jgi:DNA-binding transcriptional MerR regulator/effector-binding domain-containing protein
MSRGKNNYRYYSSEQLAIANVIRIQLELGLSLSEIKRCKGQRSPENMDEMLTRLAEQIDAKIENMADMRKIVMTLQKSIHSVLDIDEQAITVQLLPEEPIILGDLNDYSGGRNDYDALSSFFREISNRHSDINLNYPVWGLFSEERLKRGDWTFPDRYYFYNPAGQDRKPAAQYAIGYTRGGYGQTDELYRRLIAHIDRNGLEISGNAYEEYPLNEFCVSDEANYLIRVMITVRRARRSRGRRLPSPESR